MTEGQPLILAMDTATACSSVSLTAGSRCNGRVLASLNFSGNVTHSRRLLTTIDLIMKKSEVEWDIIDGICVSLGPGSFTGLRIGMATAKGIAVAANKPLLGVSTLDGLASKCTTSTLICAVLDARKKEVYSAFYRYDVKTGSKRISDLAVHSPEELAALIDEPVVMVGDGVTVYSELFSELLGDNVIFAPAQLHEPASSSLGLIARELLDAGEVLDVAEATPGYVRRSDAELNLLKKRRATFE